MFLSRGAYEPKDYHRREYWTWKPAGEKPWIFRVFTKGRFWEDERRNQKRLRGGSAEAASVKQACNDAFAMSEVDLGSMRTSQIATSFAPSSQRASAAASEGTGGGGPHGLEEVARDGELHELDVVVVPQQVHGPRHEQSSGSAWCSQVECATTEDR